MVWLVRLTLTALVAASMAVIGYQFMCEQGAERWSLDEQSFNFVARSVLLWLVLALVLYRQSYVTAIGWGMLSPIIGSIFVAGPLGPFAALAMWYVTLPVGILTGVLVKLCVSIGKQTAEPLYGSPLQVARTPGVDRLE